MPLILVRLSTSLLSSPNAPMPSGKVPLSDVRLTVSSFSFVSDVSVCGRVPLSEPVSGILRP